MTIRETGLFSAKLDAPRAIAPVKTERILEGLNRSAMGAEALTQARGLRFDTGYLNRSLVHESLGDRTTMEDACYPGLSRDTPDRGASPPRTNLLAVIDGCGGHEHGDLAGKIAAQLSLDAHRKVRFFEPPVWTRAAAALPFGDFSLHKFLADRLLAHISNVNDAIFCLSLPGLDLKALGQYLEKRTSALVALQRSWKGDSPLHVAFLKALAAGEEFLEGPKAACVFAVSFGNLVIFANIGDCRGWRFTRNVGRAGFEGECLTIDDTLYGAEYALKICNASPEDDSGSSGLTRALGCLDAREWISKDLGERLFYRYLLPTDVILLCSDGYYGRFWNQHGFYPTEPLAEVVANSHSSTVREHLVDEAARQPIMVYRNGEQQNLDNSTLLVGYSHGWY